jgi:two-component system, NarL family, nitrate/nitrite response regulator NarL
VADDVTTAGQTPPIAVHGPNRLTADIINGVIGDVDSGGRAIAVLVDPDSDDWKAAESRAVVAVLTNPSDHDVLVALRRGADAVIDANAVLVELPHAVAVVRAGGVVLTPIHARLVVDALRVASGEDRITLTRREGEILASIAIGDSVKQTALRLGIAQKTVENLQRRMFRKLDVRNRAQAVARAHELGLLDAGRVASPGITPTRDGGVNP